MQRAFIVGSPRSGTTLLQRILSRNEEVYTFPESHMGEWLWPKSSLRRLKRIFLGFSENPFLDFFRNCGKEIDQNYQAKSFFSSHKAAVYFFSKLDEMADQSDKSTWIEKTPRHLHFISHLEKVVPDAKFVHIIRKGEDVVASLYLATQEYPDEWGGKRSIETCVDRWIKDIEISRKWLHKPNHFFLTYESLVAFPENSVRQLCHHLGLGFQEQMIYLDEQQGLPFVLQKEEWKAKAAGKLDSGPSNKFSCELSGADQEFIRRKIGHIDVQSIFRAS